MHHRRRRREESVRKEKYSILLNLTPLFSERSGEKLSVNWTECGEISEKFFKTEQPVETVAGEARYMETKLRASMISRLKCSITAEVERIYADYCPFEFLRAILVLKIQAFFPTARKISSVAMGLRRLNVSGRLFCRLYTKLHKISLTIQRKYNLNF